jgi:hypothetical protein
MLQCSAFGLLIRHTHWTICFNGDIRSHFFLCFKPAPIRTPAVSFLSDDCQNKFRTPRRTPNAALMYQKN